MLRIGSQIFKTHVFLAALSGCSDLSFRLIAREEGAGFCFYEMADAHSLAYTSRSKNEDMFQSHPSDMPIAAQLLGSDPEMMLKAAKRILTMNKSISFLDINAACPVRKVIKKKAGAYLINEPEILYRVIDKLATTLEVPVTVKLRTGYTRRDPEKISEIAAQCEQSGAQAIFVHGRTQVQLYSGVVDVESIKAIKEQVTIPVMASGNIFSAQKAKEMLDLTGCDGVMVARGAFGNPWIFRQIEQYLLDGTMLPCPTLNERLGVLTRHIQYLERYKRLSDNSKVGFARKVAIWYLKGFKHAAALRGVVGQAKSMQELYKIIGTLDARSN